MAVSITQEWQRLAIDIAQRIGAPADLLLATVEAETGGRNIKHTYLSKYKQSCVGFGGILLYYHYSRVRRVANAIGETVPNWVDQQPKGGDAHTERYMQLILDRPLLSMAIAADIVKEYWQQSNYNFTTFTKKYVGPEVPQADIERRRQIYNKYKGQYTGSYVYDARAFGGQNQVSDYRVANNITPLGGKINGQAINKLGSSLIYNAPSMVMGTPPDITDDDYPPHRYASNPFVLRIGDSQFFIPPLSIQATKITSIDSKHMIRHKSPQLTKSGWTTQRLDIRLVFADTNQINGWKVAAPGGKQYYMDGLRALLAQFYRNPMLPIRNELINDRYGIYNVALYNITVTTDPEIPNMVICDLSLLECTMEPYFGLPDYMYDLMINYPLWRWYYQSMLLDKEEWRRSSTYLRPVPSHMEGKVRFRILDPALVEQMKADVVKKTMQQNPEAYINPDYILSRFHVGDIRRVMSEWDFGNPIVTNIMISINKELTPIRMDDYERPIFQDLGGITRDFIIEFYCTSRDQVESLTAMVSILEETAREYRHRFVGGFLEIHNDLINMCGIQFAMVSEYTVSTVEGIDDNYYVRMTFREFNVTQKDDERLNGINNTKNNLMSSIKRRLNAVYSPEFLEAKTNRKPQIIYEAVIEDLLDQLELYPDLELPTYEVLDGVVKEINNFRASRKQSKLPFEKFPRREEEYWAEPDFYMVYPRVQDAFRAINAGEFGAKIVNLIIDGTYQDIASEYGNITELDDMWAAISPNFVENQFNPWEAQMVFQDHIDIDIGYDLAKNHYTVPVFTDWSSEFQIPDRHDLVQMMLHDYVHYDAKYRLTRAFPTYLLMFVDEGQWIDGKRLWNNYYTYHSIHEISIVRDKDNPVDLAYISLSNTYGTFNYTSKMVDPRKYKSNATTIMGRLEQLWDSWNLSAEDVIAQSREMMDHAKLKEGARIHLRLGYSSNAKNLPICFNGHIASINDGVDIEIVAQGDGAELINQLISTDPQEGTPNEAHNAFMKYLTARQSNYWFGASAGFEFFNNYESRYGIEHFGWVESTAGDGTSIQNSFQSFWERLKTLNPINKSEDTSVVNGERTPSFINGLFDGILVDNVSWIASKITGHPNFYVYDVMKNIYRGSEQPETGVLNYGHMEIWGSSDSWIQFFKNMAERMNVFDGEKNVNFTVYNKTLWDVGKQFAMFVPEFIFAPHHHGFRSTLFFGLPHWPVKYNYRKKPNTDGLNIDHYEEVYKPFQQMHVFVTGLDIIHNNIQASSEHIHHIATGVYLRGDINTATEGITVYADRSIMIHQQKQMLVDTGVFQDLFLHDATYGALMKYGIKPIVEGIVGMSEWVLDGFQKVISIVPKGKEIAQKIEDWQDKYQLTENVSNFMEYLANPGKIAAESVTIGALQRNFMEMYQGELVLLGTPAVKPWDLFYLNDQHLKLSGTAQVGKVTHSLSKATGFTTVIKPDLVVSRTDGRGGRNYIINSATAIGTGIALRMTKTLLCSKVAQNMWRSLASWEARALQGLQNIGKSTAKIKPMKTLTTKVASWTSAGKNLFNTTNMGDKLKDFGKRALTFIKGNLFLAVATGAITEMFMTWYDKHTKYNNVIYIYPLWKSGQPFAAGIKGAMHIIPNYIDAQFADPKGAGGGQFYNMMNDYMGVDSYFTPSSNVRALLSADGKVLHPLGSFATITSRYGMRSSGMHYGIDFAPPIDKKGKVINPPVYAVADGEVIAAGYNDTMGNYVSIRHFLYGQYYVTTYMHLKKYMVKKGDHVRIGRQIGIMGNTGRVRSSTGGDGTHLHFEVQKGKERKTNAGIDPERWFDQMGVRIS